MKMRFSVTTIKRVFPCDMISNCTTKVKHHTSIITRQRTWTDVYVFTIFVTQTSILMAMRLVRPRRPAANAHNNWSSKIQLRSVHETASRTSQSTDDDDDDEVNNHVALSTNRVSILAKYFRYSTYIHCSLPLHVIQYTLDCHMCAVQHITTRCIVVSYKLNASKQTRKVIR